jgi:hypothetical protein
MRLVRPFAVVENGIARAALIQNAGVPAWWPAFGLAYDVAVAAYLVILILRGRPSECVAE